MSQTMGGLARNLVRDSSIDDAYASTPMFVAASPGNVLFTATAQGTVDRIKLCEVTGADTTITIRRIPSATANPGSTVNNLLTAAIGTGEVKASDTLFIDGPINMAVGDKIFGIAAVASRIACEIYYRERV